MRAAAICLGLAYPTLAVLAITIAAWAVSSLTLDLTVAAAFYAARHKPQRSHPIIAALIGAGIATWITGHRTDH